MKFNFRKLLPHLLAVVAFIAIAGIFASPALQGKRLAQQDSMQAKAAAQEVKKYHDETGEWSAWTNSMFGGMPAYLIATDYSTSLTTKVGQYLGAWLPEPVNLIFLQMLAAYILLLILGANLWQASIGAIAYAFGSYNILNIEAGHISKVIALAYAPGVLAGVILGLRGKYWSGAALLAVFLGLNLYGNHPQITYYVFLAIGIYVVIEGVAAIREGRIKQLVTSLAFLGVAALVAVGTHTTRLWTTFDYSKESIRGKSELTSNKQSSGGLDKDYAFNWSYGISETMTLLIPNFYGGASHGGLSTNSNLYKTLTAQGAEEAAVRQFVERAAPTYWGSQPMTGGPAYAGAIICFLFVLGCFVVRNRLKWWLLSTTVLFLAFSWGKNFDMFNGLMFDYFPYFNKFRAITMILSLVQLLMAMMTVLTLKALADENWTWAQLKQPLYISLGITAGLALLFAVVPGVFLNFRTPNDVAMLTQMIGDSGISNQLATGLADDRASLLRSDAFRSVIFIVLAAGALLLFVTKKLKANLFYPILAALVLIDLFSVDKRYLNSEDFVTKSSVEETFQPSSIDQQILLDTAPDYRVIDLTRVLTENALPSYFHKSLGGYHGAKLRRYQELIENHLVKQNMAVYNMLNTRYFIVPDQKTGNPIVQRNPEAAGNAWFVPAFKIVPNADAENKAIETFDPKKIAFIDQRFAENVKGLALQTDSTNTIQLTSYKPNALTYESNANTPQLAVFSEIFYKGNTDWKSSIDGKESPHFRANYVLRAMVVPAGKHIIEFRFDPAPVRTGHTIDLIASILLVLFVGVAVWMERKTDDEKRQ